MNRESGKGIRAGRTVTRENGEEIRANRAVNRKSGEAIRSSREWIRACGAVIWICGKAIGPGWRSSGVRKRPAWKVRARQVAPGNAGVPAGSNQSFQR